VAGGVGGGGSPGARSGRFVSDSLGRLDGGCCRRCGRLPPLRLGETTAVRAAADARDDVLVEPAERGRHEAAEVGDGQQSERNADYCVQHRYHFAFPRLGRYVPVTCQSSVKLMTLYRFNAVIHVSTEQFLRMTIWFLALPVFVKEKRKGRVFT